MSEEKPEVTKVDSLDEMPFLREALDVSGVREPPQGGHLYHYTSTEALLQILKSGTLFATDAAYFNDTSEFEYGLSILKPELERFHRTGVKETSKLVSDLVESSRSKAIYVCCFCENDDVLGQWRGYAADGAGYAVGFSHKALSRAGRLPLVRVSYGDAEVRRVCVRVIEWAVDRINGLGRTTPKGTKTDAGYILTAAISTLFLVVAASKKFVFRHEGEYRLVHPSYAMEQLTSEQIGFRSSAGLVVPHISTELPRTTDGLLDIASITCGPMRHEERRMDGIKTVLANIGLPFIPVRVSEAPLRR